MKKFLSLMGLMALGLVTSANAALPILTPIDTADYSAVAAVIVVAAGVFYGIRKAIGLLR